MSIYFKSPLSYMGNKYKLLSQIIPLFPPNINTFVDLFAGGFDVGANVFSKKVIYNDNLFPLVNLIENLKINEFEKIDNQIKFLYKAYNCEPNSSEFFYKLRADYNLTPSWDKLFLLSTLSFNRGIKFNKNGKFNKSYGRRYYGPNLQKNLKAFIERLHKLNIEFYCNDFRNIKLNFKTNDFVYCDPPYTISEADYNISWKQEDEIELLSLLDNLNSKNIKFALSNVFLNKNKININLINWAKNYKIYYLNNSYHNCYYTRQNVNSETIEVLIVNY